MSHIIESCPLTKLNGGLSRLHSADEDAVSWLTSYGSWNAYEKKVGRKSWNFYTRLYLAPPQGVIRRNFAKMFDTHKTIYWTTVWWRNCDDILSCFDTILERDGQTDGQTEFLYQYRASALLWWRAIKITMSSVRTRRWQLAIFRPTTGKQVLLWQTPSLLNLRKLTVYSR